MERLEERFLSHPSLAIEQASIAIRSMAKLACESIRVALALLENYSEEGFRRVCELEDITDTYEDKLGSYLVKIIKNELEDGQDSAVNMLLRTLTDFERMGDHAKNLAETAQEIHSKNIRFSPDAKTESANLYAAIREILAETEKAFVEDDIETAFRIAPLEEIIDSLCGGCKQNHIERVRRQICEYSHGFAYNDMLTDLERVGDHCFNLSIALQRRHGEIDARHGILTKQEIEHTHNYERIFSEYTAKYMNTEV